MTLLRLLTAGLLILTAARAADESLLVQYGFDEGQGTTSADRSANQLPAKVPAAWAPSPSGQAMAMDGTAKTVVSVAIPEALRFGKGSWTFSAWLKPEQLAIDDRQNQRRLFAFGVYPDAYLVIDLFGEGHVGGYYCYKGADGKIVSTGSGSGYKLVVGNGRTWRWCSIALRGRGVYVTFQPGQQRLADELRRRLLVRRGADLGNGAQLLGAVGRSQQLPPRAEQGRHQGGVRPLRDNVRRDAGAGVGAWTSNGRPSWHHSRPRHRLAQRDFKQVRALCEPLLARPELPANLRSYAHLRIAQAYRAEGDLPAAATEYARIAALADYPQVHRLEAAVQAGALRRVADGRPARDPEASRTRPATLDNFAAEIFVAPTGRDTNPGSQAAPVATLTRARDLVPGATGGRAKPAALR